jgi:hypothetical protein
MKGYNKMAQNKMDILQDLFVDESHTLEDLKRIKDKSHNFFKIEQKSGKILISHEYNFITKEKIVLFLIGKYLCKEVGFEEVITTSKLMSEELNIQQTSLTAPLNELESQHVLTKEGTSYKIKYYQIEKQLDILHSKYILHEEQKKTNSSTPSKIRRKPAKKKTNRPIQVKEDPEVILTKQTDEEINNELGKYELKSDNFYTIFNFHKGRLIILKGFKCQNNRESHVKSALLTLVAYRVLYDTERISSSKLREILTDSGVKDLTNLSTTLKSYNSWIVHERGRIGSINTNYRITHQGYEEGIKLVKDIVNSTSNFELKLSSGRIVNKEVAPELNMSATELEKNIREFARIENFDETKLKSSFDFQENHIRIIHPIVGKTRNVMQIKNLILLGYLIHKVYKQEKFNCEKLLKISHIESGRLDLLDKNKFFKSYFSIKRPKTSMTLIFKGRIEAKNYLENYLENGDFKL